MRYPAVFIVLGIVLACQAWWLATEATGVWWGLVAAESYLAASSIALGLVYTLRHAGLPVEDVFLRRGWSRVARGLLLPYQGLAGFTLHLYRRLDREEMMNQVAPRLYVGRLPFPSEHGWLGELGITAVLNLCAEFPRLSRLRTSPDREVEYLPIFDGSAPSDRQFQRAVDWVAKQYGEGRTVLIHCAQGHGRSVTIAAAALCRLGLAADAAEALAKIRGARPRAKPSRAQGERLARFLAREDHRS